MFQQRSISFSLGLLLAAIAGLWTIIHLILGFASSTVNDEWSVALLILFVLTLILAFVQFAQERAALRAVPAPEPFPEPALARFFQGSNGSSAMWFVVRMYVGAEWLLAGWDKITSAAWGTSGVALKGFAAGALAKSAGANPGVQGWYAWFLQHMVLPNAGLFSFLITWGEFAVGLGILLGFLAGIAAGFGVLMNLNYLLAGTVSINPVLGVMGLFLVISWRVCGWLGFDQWLLPALGLPWKPGALFHPQEATTPAPRL